ncbi:uncharacterized protein CANTADRAFT_26948 [Suhomyces tanzawaensis NRRL Y-17324]|uniref:Opaque-phase-specific protein OP4 n=1 Tax=Suhomyces tanzawaensis NRRL Y-17324 TaxID=984487 RepID=A0A1E4SEM5_9ASCO|nr:uncharacterized protein CANTADRAFT_26948 [Suhomyces tanzawaensis NRRL Y-17324]ODV77971.1 hypothetical protein CANTADRAFT_26948 [Suhomyces tanzawaensis NRRL Y-17324]
MKFAQATLVAILASCAVVGAAPVAPIASSETTMVKRVDLNEVLDLLSELKSFNTKRGELSPEEELQFISKRDGVISNLISALANSGIIGDVFNTLTSDPQISASIGAIIKATLQTAIVQAPQLLTAIWNSGLLQKLFNTLLNDTDLRNALLAAGESLISSVIGLLTGSLGGSSTPAPAPSPAPAPAPAKRELTDEEYVSKRDLASIIGTIVSEIKDSGYVQNIVQNALANPEQSIGFLTSAFKNGVVIFEDVYDWAKQSGLLNSLISSLASSNSGILSELASFVGGQLDNSSSSASAASAASPASGASINASGAAAVPVATAPASTGASSAAPANNNDNDVYAQLAAQYGGSSSSKKRRNY